MLKPHRPLFARLNSVCMVEASGGKTSQSFYINAQEYDSPVTEVIKVSDEPVSLSGDLIPEGVEALIKVRFVDAPTPEVPEPQTQPQETVLKLGPVNLAGNSGSGNLPFTVKNSSAATIQVNSGGMIIDNILTDSKGKNVAYKNGNDVTLEAGLPPGEYVLQFMDGQMTAGYVSATVTLKASALS